jgi:hypothetical protein
MDTHTRCWKKYQIRPENGSKRPELTNADYCVYDEANNLYLYTDSWVDFLVKELANEDVLNSLYS